MNSPEHFVFRSIQSLMSHDRKFAWRFFVWIMHKAYIRVVYSTDFIPLPTWRANICIIWNIVLYKYQISNHWDYQFAPKVWDFLRFGILHSEFTTQSSRVHRRLSVRSNMSSVLWKIYISTYAISVEDMQFAYISENFYIIYVHAHYGSKHSL